MACSVAAGSRLSSSVEEVEVVELMEVVEEPPDGFLARPKALKYGVIRARSLDEAPRCGEVSVFEQI